MDIFALLFILSFIALVITLVAMHIRKKIKLKDNVAKGSKYIGWTSGMLGRGSAKNYLHKLSPHESVELRNDGKMHDVIVGRTSYERCCDIDTSWRKKEVNETQEKWKETLPKHSTRIKLRNSRKLRNKRKGKK